MVVRDFDLPQRGGYFALWLKNTIQRTDDRIVSQADGSSANNAYFQLAIEAPDSGEDFVVQGAFPPL